jgi:uncharacterized protein (AIM24 family)
MVMKTISGGEGACLMKATGVGTLWVADQGKNICILRLRNQGLSVNGNDLLALDKNLKW